MKRTMVFASAFLVAAVALISIAHEPTAPLKVIPTGKAPGLLTLDLQGPKSVSPNSAERFTLVARYTDGTEIDVSDRAEWSVDSPRATVTQGMLNVYPASSQGSVSLTAWFTDDLSLKASRTVELTGALNQSKSLPEEKSRLTSSGNTRYLVPARKNASGS